MAVPIRHLHQGLILCDVFDESPKPRYVPLPVSDGREGCLMADRTVCVTHGGVTLKFVDIFPIAAAAAGAPPSASIPFVITTWTLRTNDIDTTMATTTWVMDAMIYAAELSSLDVYADLPNIRNTPS
uniref:DUF1618 domain-containing protein n=1 Tax=Oryza barthii TaxID=65489 RepID=A0A0D3HIL8_9ORYZ